jgi:glycosyltransferase involved in cell wall biosynthesis
MKVLSFSYCFPSRARPTWGVFILQRLAALRRLAELEVVSPYPVFPVYSRLGGGLLPRREELGGLTVHRPRFFYVPGLFKAQDARLYAHGIRRWLDGFCRRRRPDVFDAHFIWPDGVGVSHLAGRLRIPYAITLRGKIYPCLEDRSMRRQCAAALRAAAAVISVDSRMAEVAVELGASRERLHVIPNGVDGKRFAPMDKAQARQELGLPADAPLFVTVAHLKRTKGHDETVKALARLKQDVHLVIIGGEVERTGYRCELLALVEGLGLSGRVHLAGPQPYDRIPLYFAAADASVLASHREGCPNVVLESVSCGRPVVATDVGGARDLLSPQAGRIVPLGDVDALAAAMAEVLAGDWPVEQVRGCPGIRSWDEVAQAVWRVLNGIAPSGSMDNPGDRP